MKSGFKRYVIAWAALTVLFNVIAFAAPGWAGMEKYTPVFWIGYACIMLSLIGNLICARIVFHADSAKKLFYNLPLISIAYTSLIVSFIVGGLCMFLPMIPYWIGGIVCAIVLALFVLAVVKANTAAVLVESVDEKVQAKTSFIRNAALEAENLISKAKTPEEKAACRKVCEALRYSDPMSSPELAVVEAKITVKLDELACLLEKDDDENKDDENKDGDDKDNFVFHADSLP